MLLFSPLNFNMNIIHYVSLFDGIITIAGNKYSINLLWSRHLKATFKRYNILSLFRILFPNKK